MNEQFEKLIDLALADGVLTNKEKEVLYKKAKELNVDQNEFEMVLDAKLYSKQTEASPKPKSNKHGDIKKCPSCGAPMLTQTLKCPECQHEFTEANLSSSLQKFEDALAEINNKGGKIKDEFDADEFITLRTTKLIESIQFPNNKDDLLSFLSYFSSKVITNTDFESENIKAYYSRAMDICTKLKFLVVNEPNLLNFVNDIEQRMIKRQKKNSTQKMLLLVLGFPAMFFGGYLMYGMIARMFGFHWWPF